MEVVIIKQKAAIVFMVLLLVFVCQFSGRIMDKESKTIETKGEAEQMESAEQKENTDEKKNSEQKEDPEEVKNVAQDIVSKDKKIEEKGGQSDILYNSEKSYEKNKSSFEGDNLGKEKQQDSLMNARKKYGDSHNSSETEKQRGDKNQKKKVQEQPQQITGDTDVDFEKMIENIDRGVEAKINATLPKEDFTVEVEEPEINTIAIQ